MRGHDHQFEVGHTSKLNKQHTARILHTWTRSPAQIPTKYTGRSRALTARSRILYTWARYGDQLEVTRLEVEQHTA